MMKNKWKYLLGMGTLVTALVTGFTLSSENTIKIKADTKPFGVIDLAKDTVYEYDLDGDGTPEKLEYKLSGNEDDYKAVIDIYVNGKLCFSKTDDGFSYIVKLTDLDASDKYLDLQINTQIESDCVRNAFFARYQEGKISEYQKFDPKKLTKNFSTTRYSLNQADGSGRFMIVMDTPIFSEAIGCYNCYVPFQLKQDVISKVSTKTYDLTEDSAKYRYKAVKRFAVYDKPGSKTVVFRVSKGNKVTFDQLYVTASGKAYFRIKNSGGAQGWIKSDQSNLFALCPMWG